MTLEELKKLIAADEGEMARKRGIRDSLIMQQIIGEQ